MSKPNRQPSVVIIGAGMAGILVYIKLQQAGISNISIIEKKSSVGGTWRENTYPGLCCDVAAHFYSYSFAPNSSWSQTYASGSELRNYFEKISDEFNVTPNINFNEEVTDATFDGKRWQVTTSKDRNIAADFVFSATGILHRPVMPKIEGLASFGGASFHTAEWDHNIDLNGKRVGIIGTGSTSIQVCSELINQGVDLTVFQRTAQWVLPIPNPKSSKLKRALFKWLPFSMTLSRKMTEIGLAEIVSKALVKQGFRLKLLEWICNKNLASIKDPTLRKRLTPDYKVGCKRIIVSSRFYKAMQQPNAKLVIEGIECIEPTGVKTSDDKLHQLDVLVYATGFDPLAYMRPIALSGTNKLSINDAWQNKLENYRSLFIPCFPNFFLMLGPNCPSGNFSLTHICEIQVDYCLQLIKLWQDGQIDSFDAKKEAAKKFIEEIKAGLSTTVWTSGCNSWYLDQEGDPILWPYSISDWKKHMVEPELNDFNFTTS